MFEKRVLSNGLRVLFEKIPYVKSVSIGVWIGTGSSSEISDNNGISHFIEHMVFKGTKTRSAKEIAESIDGLGGQLNAFTGKECTCYYVRCLDSHIDIAVEVLADMLFNSKFESKDMKLEKKVIFEEIDMYEDSPDELVHDNLNSIAWENTTLGYSILGTKDVVGNISKNNILEYMSEKYTAKNSVIAVAGNFDIDSLMATVEKYFGQWKSGSRQKREGKIIYNSGISIKEKDIEQIHLCLGMEAIEQGNEKLYTEIAINNVFGGGMSSRLFQKIRENKGLVYSIYSYPISYKDAGLFSIYAAMNPANLKEVIKLVVEELDELCLKGLDDKEIRKTKEQLKGGYIIGLESTSSRMNNIGKSELMLDRVYTQEEILGKIDRINKETVNEIIEQVFKSRKMSLAVVGKLTDDIDFNKMIDRK